MTLSEFLKSGLVAAAALAVLTSVAEARPSCPGHPSCKDVEEEPDAPSPSDDYDGGDIGFPDDYIAPDSYYSWMHEDVGLAHNLGYTGIGSNLIILDDYLGSTFDGNLTGVDQNLTHGGWTSLQARLVAPSASYELLQHPVEGDSDVISDYYSGAGLQVVNLSFGLIDRAGLDPNSPLGFTLWDSLVDEAITGSAVFVKAAGNTNGGTVDGTFTYFGRQQDYLNLQLIGAQGAIFVGALDGNGTVDNLASIASYSTIAGSTTAVQEMFLVVGVDSSEMGGLAGTSFAAPIVSGYAAILGQKFAGASASAVVDQLLYTARTDMIADFGANCTSYSSSDATICTLSSVYGVGEADLSRALSPSSIN